MKQALEKTKNGNLDVEIVRFLVKKGAQITEKAQKCVAEKQELVNSATDTVPETETRQIKAILTRSIRKSRNRDEDGDIVM